MSVLDKSSKKAKSGRRSKKDCKLALSDGAVDSSAQQAKSALNIREAAPEAGTNFVTRPAAMARLNVRWSVARSVSEICSIPSWTVHGFEMTVNGMPR